MSVSVPFKIRSFFDFLFQRSIASPCASSASSERPFA
jgi:hypothetical protein